MHPSWQQQENNFLGHRRLGRLGARKFNINLRFVILPAPPLVNDPWPDLRRPRMFPGARDAHDFNFVAASTLCG